MWYVYVCVCVCVCVRERERDRQTDRHRGILFNNEKGHPAICNNMDGF